MLEAYSVATKNMGFGQDKLAYFSTTQTLVPSWPSGFMNSYLRSLGFDKSEALASSSWIALRSNETMSMKCLAHSKLHKQCWLLFAHAVIQV